MLGSAIESVRNKEAICRSKLRQNTGALMALSMIRLKSCRASTRHAKLPCFIRRRNPQGFNVLLDVGADVRADADESVALSVVR